MIIIAFKFVHFHFYSPLSKRYFQFKPLKRLSIHLKLTLSFKYLNKHAFEACNISGYSA